MSSPPQPVLEPARDYVTPARIARSIRGHDEGVTTLAAFQDWLDEHRRQAYTRSEQVPLAELEGWSSDPTTGNIGHRSGKFFTIEGVAIDRPAGVVPRWTQPIINQPEVGILGILVKEFDGVLHLLLQAKAEPGNLDGAAQLTPTVQATRSNYSRAHGGRAVPYVEYFLDTAAHQVITDVRQSEQASWFHHKRNRNMVVEVADDVELAPGFRWLTLGQIHQLLAVDDLVTMDVRTVLSCLPFASVDLMPAYGRDGDDFRTSLIRSCSEGAGSLHPMPAILSWITERRSSTDLRIESVPLNTLTGWRRTAETISHESGRFFDVVGMRITAGGREVGAWTQPMIRPHGVGIVAFLVRSIRGVLHVLVNARVEPGYLDVVELAPTVQCIPENYEHLPASARPLFLDEVLTAAPDRIRFDAVLSEQGGRFYQARNRHLLVETDLDEEPPPDYRWLTLHQLVELLQHSNYLNVQARSLVTCLHGLTVTAS